MKLLVVFLLALTTAAAIHLGYRSGKRYTYEYEGTIAHGIPEAFDKDVAVRIRAKVHCDYQEDGYVVLRLQDVALATIKGQVLVADRFERKEKETTPQNEVQEHLRKCLEMPVKFQFKARAVEKEITASKQEPEWCLNVKRAMINHLYLPINDNAETYQTREDEVTIAGKCKTAYTIIAKKPYYLVKRVIDISQCTASPKMIEYNIPSHDEVLLKRKGCTQRKQFPVFVRSGAYMHYDLQGDTEQGFLIRQVISENAFDYPMLGDEYKSGKGVAARIEQKFKLCKKDQPIPQTAKKITDEQKRGGLMFVYDSGAQYTQTEEAQKNILSEAQTHVAAIKDQLAAGGVKPEVAQFFARLVSTLRRCNQKALEQYTKDCLATQNDDLRKIQVDALARVGTPAAAAVIKMCLADGKLNDYLTRVLFGIGWTRGLNADFMNNVKEICQQTSVAAKPQAQRTCWLSFGNVVNRLMIALRMYPRLTQDTKLMALKDTFAKTLRDGLANGKDNEEKLTYLKAIGNAGWINMDVFKAVAAILTNSQMPLHMKVQAAWAMRHMAMVKPKQARQCLLPLFANALLDPELRIACYKILFRADPCLLTCQKIASVVAREAACQEPRSNQVVAFIASDLRTSIRLDNLNWVRASRARYILRFIPRNTAYGLFAYSKAINIALGDEKRYAWEIRFNKINGPQTFIPRHLNTKFILDFPAQGSSTNFFEMGTRVQGIHDILQPLILKKGGRTRRSLDILNYIFGAITNDAETHDQNETQGKLPERFSYYWKLFGSEVYYGKLVKADLVKLIKDALFGQGTATEGGFTFSKNSIMYKRQLTAAHLFMEKRRLLPTLIGIPFKTSVKTASALQLNVEAGLTGKPQIITMNHEQLQANIKMTPNVVFHFHYKMGVWLPVFESGLIVKNEVQVVPKIHGTVTLTKNKLTAEFPVDKSDQPIFDVRATVHAILRKELTPGVRQWQNIDLAQNQRGIIEIPKTCYGGQYFGLAACVQGKVTDRQQMRIRRLATYPYIVMGDYNMVLKQQGSAPWKFKAMYDIKTNNADTYLGEGEIDYSEKTKIIFSPKCDKTKMTCEVPWSMKNNEICPQDCKCMTVIDASTANKITFRHTYGNMNMNNEITFEKDGTLMRVANTWNKLPDRIHNFLCYYHPKIIVMLSRYFGIEGVRNPDNKCEIRVQLYDRRTADICVDAPTMKLRRLNQELPIELRKFPTTNMEIESMLKSFYGTCQVKGKDYVKTTDNVVIKQQIPGTCPYVLAEDARGDKAAWRILLKLNQQGQQNLMVVIKEKRFKLCQDMTVEMNGKKVPVQPEFQLPGVLRIKKTAGNKLFVEASAGFQCLFDGTQAVVLFLPWWHNRIRGVCGNNDGEQWTDLITRRKTYVPETLRREFLREWVVEGKDCQDKQCQLKAKNVKLAAGAPKGQVCFTNGRFLQCMAKCKPQKQQTLTAAYHCLPANSPLVNKIAQGDKTVDVANMSADVMATVTEHLSCQCSCT